MNKPGGRRIRQIEKGEQYTHREYGEVVVESIELTITTIWGDGELDWAKTVQWRAASANENGEVVSGETPHREFFKLTEAE